MFKYIYYKIYKIAKKSEMNVEPNMRMPATVSLFTMSILHIINLITFIIFLADGLNLFIKTSFTLSEAIFSAVTICTVNYFCFVRNNKSKIIEQHFDKEPKNLTIIKTCFFWIYVLLSIFLFIYVLQIGVNTN